MANEPSRIGQQVDSLLQPTNPNRLHIVPQTSSMIQQQLTGEKSSNSSAQPPRAGTQDQDVAPNYTDIPASPYNRRVNKRRRYLEPHLGGQSYASVFSSSTESDAVSDNDRYLFQPIAHPSSAHNASTPSNVSHNPHSQMRLSTVTAYAATESTSATSAGHPDCYSYGNENNFGHLPSFSHAGSMGTSESDFQLAPSVVHGAFSAVSANGFSKTQGVIYVDAHPQPFTNSQDEFAQDVQGKGWTIPQVAKGLKAFPRSVEEVGFDFQEGRALLDESEHATLSPVVTASVSPSEIDASASADGEGIITNEDKYLTPGSTTSTSDDENLLEDQDNIPSGAHGSTLEATHINPLTLLPVEVWAQIVRYVVEVSQDDKERLRNLGRLRYLNITNLKREVDIAQWSVAMIRAGRSKAIDGLEAGRRKESEKKCLGAIRKVVFTVPRRDCLKDNLLYDCGQKSFINIIGQLTTENITWLKLDSFSELGAMAHQAFDKAIDQMTNLQVVQLPRLSKRSKVAKASIAFVVSSGPKGITICCPAYTSLSIVPKLMGRMRHKDLRLIFHDIRGSTTETDFKVLFKEVDFENVHTVCGVSIDMMLLARYILPGVLQKAKRISMFQCTGVREFYDTQSEHENAVEFLQWHDLPESGPSTMQAQL